MDKPFLEVFPKLNINAEIKDLLSFAVVNKLQYTEDRKNLLIFTTFSRLIPKNEIRSIEKMVTEQVLSGYEMKALISETYMLPEKYDISSILNEYSESLHDELKEQSPLNARLFSKGQAAASGDTITLDMSKNTVAAGREKEISAFLQKIFLNRFHMAVHVAFTHKDPKKPHVMSHDLRDSMFYDHSAPSAKSEVSLKDVKKTSSPAAEAASDDAFEALAREYAASGFEEAPADDLQIPGAAEISGLFDGNAEGSVQIISEKTEEKPAAETQKVSPVNTGKAEQGNLRKRSGREGRVAEAKKTFVSDDPNVLYGRPFNEEAQPILYYGDIEGPVVIRGKILSTEIRELRDGVRSILSFGLTDYSDSITGKIFLPTEEAKELDKKLKPGTVVRLRGNMQYDTYDKEMSISRVFGMMLSEEQLEKKRVDMAPVKRVELHCHTKSSKDDGLASVGELMKTVKGWGHKAMAVTDHGCVYAFPEAFHGLDKNDTFKVIYGMEGYLVDDTREIAVNPIEMSLDGRFVVFDIETTGFSPVNDRIIEIGAVLINEGKVVDRFSTFVDPLIPIPYRIEKLTGISDQDVKDAPQVREVLQKFLEFSKGAVLVAHNASFDMSFIKEKARVEGIYDGEFSYVDTLGIARNIIPQISRYTLDHLAKELKVPLGSHHRAVDDAECTAGIFLKLVSRLQARGMKSVMDIGALKPNADAIRKMPTYHVIILAQNETGRVNLYKLVSESCLNYFARRPRIPKSLLNSMREGLIIGSACEAGELFEAIREGASEDRVEQLVNFYDYLEIQPIGNNEFMIESDRYDVDSREQLIHFNEEIVALGEKYHKPVCATCDVHFLNPEDDIYRAILQAGCGFDEEKQPPLYMRTTEEMLEEFSYLGTQKAYEVVVENTNLIADMIERIEPVRPDKCPPVIENADKDLEDEVYQKAHELYGDPLPDIVKQRVDRELTSIISNGYAVMYMIAEKLVSKSVSDGYLVGSRGSVGSSLVATMSGITEVNPLPPHYRCPKCKYSDFDSELVKSYADNSGCDMPDAVCPVCGEPMVKDGYNIPFETFLGFKGDKEPDIDLNFSGEYQAKAHAYTEVIFGQGQTFRAGTVGAVAEKTAQGYVFHYYEDKGIHKRRVEIERIAKKLEGVRRTSGQHPGGIIVLPIGEDINTFTPVQHPADDPNSSTITTHFDYHSIDHNLLKLDILGHDDPTMIRMIQDLTQIDPRTFPLDSREVMSLFQSTEALGVTPEEIRGCPLGALGLPEFGTDNAINMLLDAKPQYVSDLIRISGLSHGTNVWHGNAKTLIEEGKCTIATAVCTRDDIMVYLISMGVDPAEAFSIMENVRKGKVAKGKCKDWNGWKEDMKAHNVPDWYIWSCERIEYMFPKAHAAAYVMMALRIAYCKIFYPLAYYAAFFSIRANGFNYELMCLGKERLEHNMDEYEKRFAELPGKPSAKDADTFRDMRISQEMYARGYEFVPIDIYKASATRFQIVGDKALMPSLKSIDGMGETAAENVVEAAKKGPFTSLGNFKTRTKVSQTIIDKMVELHILDKLPKEDQFSLFDTFN